ncbi:MAG: hypothetical protein PHH81_11580 [Bacteroides graminisolvens]|nr:hypothetical protein [Bacteroides graminisolvens]
MNKNLTDYQIIELLDIKNLLQTYSIEDLFDTIAKKLFDGYHIKKGDSAYDFLEIEFYYFDKEHLDYITYHRTINKGKWFFHPSGMDISFESSCEEGFEKTSKAGENFFGGILIRSLVKDGNIAITGPLKCCWELFDCFSAFELKPNELPIIERRSVVNQFEIYKTKRFLNFEKSKAGVKYGGNFKNFEDHLLKRYRYYNKHPKWEEIKTSDYKARPLNSDNKDIRL